MKANDILQECKDCKADVEAYLGKIDYSNPSARHVKNAIDVMQAAVVMFSRMYSVIEDRENVGTFHIPNTGNGNSSFMNCTNQDKNV